MPENRPGRGVYVTNGGSAVAHGSPQKLSNYVGVIVKQVGRNWADALSVQAQIEASEAAFLITKGTVLVPVTGISSPAKGDAVYITSANALTKTATSNSKFGRIYDVAGQRGVPTGYVRIDLDAKDSF